MGNITQRVKRKKRRVLENIPLSKGTAEGANVVEGEDPTRSFGALVICALRDGGRAGIIEFEDACQYERQEY